MSIIQHTLRIHKSASQYPFLQKPKGCELGRQKSSETVYLILFCTFFQRKMSSFLLPAIVVIVAGEML